MTARGRKLPLIWCVPLLGLAVSLRFGELLRDAAWPTVLVWMGIACLLSARRCRRLHCFLTAPLLLLLAGVALLFSVGVVSVGAHGCSVLSVILVVAPILYVVPEWRWGKYRTAVVD